MNARLPTLVSVPLVVAGSLAAHLTAGELLSPDAGGPAEAHGVHAYLGHGPLAVAVLLSLAFVAVAVQGMRHPSRARVHLSTRAFVLLPFAIYTAQELGERAIHGDLAPFGTVTSQGFLVGLALQIPFAALMYLIARAAQRLGERLSLLLLERGRPLYVAAFSPALPCGFASPPRIAALAGRAAGRAPPVLSAA